MHRAQLQEFLAEGLTLREIGQRVGKDPSTVGYWLGKHGLTAVHHDKHAAKGGIDEELLRALVAEGLSVERIASTLGLSVSTVNYWLKRRQLRTVASARRSQARQAKESGAAKAELECRHHGRTDFVLDAQGRYRCIACRRERVVKHRRRRKQQLVQEAGGRCRLCGYQRYVGALQFHHLDPANKQFGVAQRGVGRALSRTRAEARKCILLCANCHAEVEAGVVDLPSELATLRAGRDGPG